MTTIRATCPHCGEVDLTPDDIRLTVVRAPGAPVGPHSFYAFTCPSCTERVHKPADERIARLLTTGGVRVEVVDEAEEDLVSGVDELDAPLPLPPHPEEPRDADALTYDDVLDFHLLLERPDWFAELLALSR